MLTQDAVVVSCVHFKSCPRQFHFSSNNIFESHIFLSDKGGTLARTRIHIQFMQPQPEHRSWWWQHSFVQYLKCSTNEESSHTSIFESRLLSSALSCTITTLSKLSRLLNAAYPFWQVFWPLKQQFVCIAVAKSKHLWTPFGQWKFSLRQPTVSWPPMCNVAHAANAQFFIPPAIKPSMYI